MKGKVSKKGTSERKTFILGEKTGALQENRNRGEKRQKSGASRGIFFPEGGSKRLFRRRVLSEGREVELFVSC